MDRVWAAAQWLLLFTPMAVARAGFGDRQGEGHPLYVLNEGVGPSALSVEKMVKVATWPIQRRSGQREWDIIDEGILAHPHTQKVENPAEADFIIFVTVQDVDFEKKLILGEGSFANEGWNSKDWGPHIAKKMIVVDYADAPDDHGGLRELLDTRFGPPKVPFPVAQFKRSWLHKHNGTIWLTQKFGANEDAKGHEYICYHRQLCKQVVHRYQSSLKDEP